MKISLCQSFWVALLVAFAGCSLVAGSSSALEQQEPPSSADIPIEAFAALPSMSQPKLSPDGTRLSFLTTVKGKNHVAYQNLDGSDRGIVPPVEGMEVVSHWWANDNFLLVEVSYEYERVGIGRRAVQTRMLSVDTKKNKAVWLGRPKRMTANDYDSLSSQFEHLVDILPDDPDKVLLQLALVESNYMDAVYEVNVKNGRRKMVQSGRPDIQNWYTDFRSDVRLGTGVRTLGANSERLYGRLKTENDTWIAFEPDWLEDHTVVGFTNEANIVYVAGPSEFNTRALLKLDVRTGEIKETIFASPNYDIGATLHHPVTNELAGVTVTEHLSRHVYFDADLSSLQTALERSLPGTNIWILGRARTRNIYVIRSSSDKNPGDYYLFNRDKKELSYLAPRMEAIATAQYYAPDILRGTTPVTFPARDGETIPAYLTLPASKWLDPGPAIILPHGGPNSRDSASWDFWAQFYASRGYAVLQPNFRGSSGYGSAYQEAGQDQWGRLMQDDVTDATRWLIESGHADPARICIVGGSYGGYSALMGAIKEPNLYRCAISVNGVTDYAWQKRYRKSFLGGYLFDEESKVQDEDISPFHRATQINVPILLIAAKDDAVVPYEMSRAFHKRLRGLKKKSRFVAIESGGHSLQSTAARLTMLKETERFLRKHIGD